MKKSRITKSSIFVRIMMACILPLICVFIMLAITTNQIVYNQITMYAKETSTIFAYEIAERINMDMPYEDQFYFVGEKDIENERMLLLMTQDGKIVYSGDNRFLNESIFDMPYGNTDHIKEALGSDELSIFEGVSPFHKVRSVMSFNLVSADFAGKQLYLYIDMPTSTLLRPVADATRMMAVLSALGLLVLGITLLLIIRNTLKPIKKLTEDANIIAGGALDADFVLEFEGTDSPADTKNEIVLLSVALKKMLDRFKHFQALERREQALIADNNTLDRLSRMKTEFFRNMSHDFKTPLTVISTSVHNAADMLDFEIDKDDMSESLDNAHREIMRMARMVDSAMEHSFLHDNRQDMKPIDITPLLRESAETYRAVLEGHGNTLSLDIPAALPRILGNTDILFHVLSNLLSNANRYTYNGKISILAEEENGIVAVTVRDNGMGVKPEILPRVFERGVSDGGTGLGLPICKDAIEAHNGTISVKSEYGHGTEVTFTLTNYNEDLEGTENGK